MAISQGIPNTGLALMTALMKVGTGAEPHHVGWGTGGTAYADANTGLETAAAESRVEGTTTQQTTTVTNDTYRVVATITCTGAGKTISEVCLFDAATSGNLFMRSVFSGTDAIGLSVGDSITFTFNIKVERS